MKKYKNQNDVPIFGKYTDPYGERRVKGNKRPSMNTSIVKVNLKKEYNEQKLYCTWLGHSSVFLHMQKQNILIDPIFSMYASPIQFVGPKRYIGETINISSITT